MGVTLCTGQLGQIFVSSDWIHVLISAHSQHTDTLTSSFAVLVGILNHMGEWQLLWNAPICIAKSKCVCVYAQVGES